MAYELVITPVELPSRPIEGNKGSFGRALILAGSVGMSGAAALSGMAALRGGAGLVTVAVPAPIQPIVAGFEPSYMTLALPATADGQFSRAVLQNLEKLVPNASAVACGPGWGQSDELIEILGWLMRNVRQPLVIDADALNLLARTPDILGQATGPRILTPHPGEFARLINSDVPTVQRQRIDLAVEFAAKYRVVVLLKGAGTVITDGTRVAVNTTGNSGMGTGGTGDVLTGLITALLGQGLDAFAAARLGAHLHGLAGDLAAADLSQPGLIASDLPRYFGPAWLQMLANPE
ncbi:MAG: nnr 1 [Planctomycetaceae bacterium]|nr:nnr 1 [Planctomycetaceae bacterium]